ncbi:MAG: hypothetical protein Q9187_001684 [Circinaria calcarea]
MWKSKIDNPLHRALFKRPDFKLADMTLVGYSDSEDSGGEEAPLRGVPPNNSAPKISKPIFKKVIDSSNPHKIKVSLPETSKVDQDLDADGNEPPAKRTKIGPGAFSDFNSILPSPKRAVVSNGASTSSGIRKGALGSGVSLKTGSAPGFSREPMPDRDVDVGNGDRTTELAGRDSEIQLPNSNSASTTALLLGPLNGVDTQEAEPKKQGNPMMFKPLSVARKPQKKKKGTENLPNTPLDARNDTVEQTTPVSKVSLFSIGSTDDDHPSITRSTGEYRTLLYEKSDGNAERPGLDTFGETELEVVDNASSGGYHQPPGNLDNTSQSLDSIAADLNLSASAKRQLLGRQRSGKNDTSSINIVNFNTDQEYASNELLRQAGEQVQHNPVRALASGKHSLKQLVNAANTQKDALEEQFASGRRNKKEAGSKYGW